MNLQPVPPAGTAPPTPMREILAFKLGGEDYGIDIRRVQEIRSYDKPTRIANAPDFVKGVINLRGAIVPIIDMRLKLKLAQAAYDSFTVVIVLNLGARAVGMVVDAVSDVVTLASEQLRAVPEPGGLAGEHRLAIGAVDGRMLILVDVAKLLSGAEIGLAEPTLQ
jgi:purine-binding chemotaxis protein CheW